MFFTAGLIGQVSAQAAGLAAAALQFCYIRSLVRRNTIWVTMIYLVVGPTAAAIDAAFFFLAAYGALLSDEADDFEVNEHYFAYRG